MVGDEAIAEGYSTHIELQIALSVVRNDAERKTCGKSVNFLEARKAKNLRKSINIFEALAERDLCKVYKLNRSKHSKRHH